MTTPEIKTIRGCALCVEKRRTEVKIQHGTNAHLILDRENAVRLASAIIAAAGHTQ